MENKIQLEIIRQQYALFERCLLFEQPNDDILYIKHDVLIGSQTGYRNAITAYLKPFTTYWKTLQEERLKILNKTSNKKLDACKDFTLNGIQYKAALKDIDLDGYTPNCLYFYQQGTKITAVYPRNSNVHLFGIEFTAKMGHLLLPDSFSINRNGEFACNANIATKGFELFRCLILANYREDAEVQSL